MTEETKPDIEKEETLVDCTPDQSVPEETKPALPKTKARISHRGVLENIVLKQETDASMGVAFNHLQDIVLKSIESMLALSANPTVKFLQNITEEILPQAQQAAEDYNKAVLEAFESMEVEVMPDEEFANFYKEKTAAQENSQEETQETKKPGLGLVQTQWEE